MIGFMHRAAGAGIPTIPGSILVVQNPMGGGGRAEEVATALEAALSSMKAAGAISFEGDLFAMATRPDPAVRIDRIVEQIEALAPSQEEGGLTVVAAGGDRTVSDVAAAIDRVRIRHGALADRVVLAAGPGGTIGDLRRITGAPRRPSRFVEFLARADIIALHGMRVRQFRRDGRAREDFSLFGSTWGESGRYFMRLEELKVQQGGLSLLRALAVLPEAIAASGRRYLRVSVDGVPLCGGRLLEVSESGANVCHEQGVIFAFPLQERGARFFAYEPLPWGAGPVLETFVRGVAACAGFPRAVRGERMLLLARERQRDILPGETVRLEFFDATCRPLEQYGTVSGDAAGPACAVELTGSVHPTRILAARDSGLMARQGLSSSRFSAFHLRDWAEAILRRTSKV